jgi:electron transfer flavoprotein beta subunit
VAAVEEINLSARRLSARRRLDNGVETVEARLPALLTCIDELNEIRYATMPNMIRAARYDPEVWRRADLDVEDERLGLKGSATVVSRIFAPPARPPGEMIPGDDAAAAANALADRMVAAAARLHSGSPS